MRKPVQVYNKDKNVVEAAQERIALLFDLFKNINVSVSGGKDSTVLAHLVVTEAKKRGRKVTMFFVDEEAVYQSTINQVEYLMQRLDPSVVVPAWLQVEFNLTNAVSLKGTRFLAWERGKHKDWIRSKKSYSIKRYPWDKSREIVSDRHKGIDFYDVIRNFENTKKNTAFIVGLRSEEAINRRRVVSKNPVTVGEHKIYWGTARGNDNFSFYPLYDWHTSDIWKYIYDNKIKYHKMYDLMFKKGYNVKKLRISSLIHEKSFKSLIDLPEYEPETFNRLVNRTKGILFAHETAKDSKMFKTTLLPKAYTSWITYRDFLLATHPVESDKQVFIKRFSKQLNNEYVARQQVRQLILNDFENNLPVTNKPDPREQLLAYYKEVL